MSITPLDLQTLFLKMANVGKEQAAIQKSVEHQQEREGDQIVKDENNRDHSVNKSEEAKDSEKINDNSDAHANGKHENHKNKDKEKNEDKTKYFTDPERGHNIDISG